MTINETEHLCERELKENPGGLNAESSFADAKLNVTCKQNIRQYYKSVKAV